MKRGEIWTLQDKHYASKARPVVVIQSDKHDSFDSVILCLFTSYESGDISTRVRIEPSSENGLQKVSYVMTDKIVTVDKSMLGKRVGVLSDDDMLAVSEQLRAILGL
ncbi:MAG: type II toxin-antitoxin system PemK/MazF family toxin [Lachnospiraceae bacterium]|nr:type II toxin-antitoxin system PemK/MazF family toxin [Lachnospiraceae bacterium]